mmetsp:Transcript_66760/g.177829  ORF Transcript_66760/g.177829 Transcript_66760/m.177829 type:complete len:247 (+) Transcript_66760:356-1096(+)
MIWDDALNFSDVGLRWQRELLPSQLEGEVRQYVYVAAIWLQSQHLLAEPGDDAPRRSYERHARVQDCAAACVGGAAQLRGLVGPARRVLSTHRQGQVGEIGTPRVVPQHGDVAEDIRLGQEGGVVPDNDPVRSGRGAQADREGAHVKVVEQGRLDAHLVGDLEPLLHLLHQPRWRLLAHVKVGGDVADDGRHSLPCIRAWCFGWSETDQRLEGRVGERRHVGLLDGPEALPHLAEGAHLEHVGGRR